MALSLPVIFFIMLFLFLAGAVTVFIAFKKDAAKQIEQQQQQQNGRKS